MKCFFLWCTIVLNVSQVVWAMQNYSDNVLGQLNREISDRDRLFLSALIGGHKNIVRHLLACGGDDLHLDLIHPLHIAADCGQDEICCDLLQQKVCVNQGGYGNLTPLHIASKNGFYAMCCVLLEHGADVNKRDAEGKTALHYAAGNGYTGICRLLLEQGAGPNQLSHMMASPLHHAAGGTHKKTLYLLVEFGAYVYQKDSCGYMPMDYLKYEISYESLCDAQKKAELLEDARVRMMCAAELTFCSLLHPRLGHCSVAGEMLNGALVHAIVQLLHPYDFTQRAIVELGW